MQPGTLRVTNETGLMPDTKIEVLGDDGAWVALSGITGIEIAPIVVSKPKLEVRVSFCQLVLDIAALPDAIKAQLAQDAAGA